jgi:hypothetical protein
MQKTFETFRKKSALSPGKAMTAEEIGLPADLEREKRKVQSGWAFL